MTEINKFLIYYPLWSAEEVEKPFWNTTPLTKYNPSYKISSD